MNNILQAFLEWVKDPFGKKDITAKHNEVIHNIYAAQAVTKKTTVELQRDIRKRQVQRSMRVRGATAFDRTFIGTQQKIRDEPL